MGLRRAAPLRWHYSGLASIDKVDQWKSVASSCVGVKSLACSRGHLKLAGESGTQSDYETMTKAARQASREEAVAKLVGTCRTLARQRMPRLRSALAERLGLSPRSGLHSASRRRTETGGFESDALAASNQEIVGGKGLLAGDDELGGTVYRLLIHHPYIIGAVA